MPYMMINDPTTDLIFKAAELASQLDGCDRYGPGGAVAVHYSVVMPHSPCIAVASWSNQAELRHDGETPIDCYTA